MKSIKRAPLWGQVALIILILITIITFTNYVQLEQVNHSLNVTINEQKQIINVLENENSNLKEQIIKLETEINDKDKNKDESKNDSNDTKTLGKFKISAYCHCSKCCGKSDGITATGTKVTANRTIAVDPKVIPLGSQVIIDGKIYIAEDVGGNIKGNRIDMYFPSHQAALNWGIKYKDVSIIINT